jgi:hypothetical protein
VSGTRLYCQFEVYGAGKDAQGAPHVSAGYTLRRSDGVTLAGMDPTPIPPGPQGQLSRIVVLSLVGADAGDYEVALIVRDELSGKNLVVREPFVVRAEAIGKP